MNLDDKKKLILTIAGACVVCVLIAIGVYSTLKTVAPKDDPAGSAEVTTPPTSAAELTVRAEASIKAGEEAFNNREPEKAVEKFEEAKALYEQAGDTVKAEQTADRIAVAKHEAEVNHESEPEKAPEDPAPTEEEEAEIERLSEFTKTTSELD